MGRQDKHAYLLVAAAQMIVLLAERVGVQDSEYEYQLGILRDLVQEVSIGDFGHGR